MSILSNCRYARASGGCNPVLPSYRRFCHHRATVVVRCTVITPSEQKLQLHTKQQPFTHGQPSISVNAPTADDPSLQSTWVHRAWVTGGCATLLISLAKSFTAASTSHMYLQPALAGLAGYILADLGSGVYHWGIDNYGGPSTPVVGGQIEAFQGHHKWPWTITKRQFANNLHALAKPIAFFVLPVDLACNDPMILAFVGMFAGCIMFSQQFHAWAHGTKSKLPRAVLALQDLGVLVSRTQHGAHHRPPFKNNYCIVSGVWNEFLDQNKVFEAMEMVIYFRFGVRPRSWSEPSLEWIEEDLAVAVPTS